MLKELLVIGALGALGGLLVGPPLGYWSVRWEDALDRHRRHCLTCQQRARRREARAARKARRA
ncbi:hypothetical protein [Actinophytocola xanthii]|uniref:Uncharacterized protein n=1 Tax=Actinophytocola xanthii TaxID=1912961 RepID=A0A1Q8CUA8_9PSEU|nr:hypothetical protein [Actinophytocola xanthii]OLF17945.1 hypothetical protein BU204_09045 [Actinophytocola xanthii]